MMNDKAEESNSFQLFNNYYDLIYQEKNYLKESQYVTGILKKYNIKSGNLLELGSGTGNYSKQLSKEGYKITGIEKSEHLVALAKSKLIPHFTPIVGDITTFKINKKFDAAISLFHVIGYLTENKKILSCLKQVMKHLKKHGVFIFDVWYTPSVYAQQPKNKIKYIESDTYKIKRIADPVINYEKNVVQVNYQMIVKNKVSLQQEVLKETHFMRHFSTPEIKLMAKLSEFRFIHCEEFLTAKAPSADTWGVCYILQKV